MVTLSNHSWPNICPMLKIASEIEAETIFSVTFGTIFRAKLFVSQKMSKLEVKVLEPSKSEMFSSCIRSCMENGRRINLERYHTKQVPISARKNRRKPAESRDVLVWKILFPRRPKYSNCNHNDGVILNRQALGRSDHLSYLAQPKKVNLWIIFFYKRFYNQRFSGSTRIVSTLDRKENLPVYNTG